MQIESYFLGTAPVTYDYSLIRKAGAPIRGFGGESSGSRPLADLHEAVEETLRKEVGSPISQTAIVDIMNLVGKCVVAGNVRRSAEIVFGPADSEEYIDLKNYEVNPQRSTFGWTSNNSVFAKVGMDYNVITSYSIHYTKLYEITMIILLLKQNLFRKHHYHRTSLR